jgi:hypothetical protein
MISDSESKTLESSNNIGISIVTIIVSIMPLLEYACSLTGLVWQLYVPQDWYEVGAPFLIF